MRKKLIYSCSGCSSAAQMANWISVYLDRAGIAEMSCIAGVGGGVPALIKKTVSADCVIAIDGCPLACAEHCLAREGFESDLHYDLSEMGVKKKKHADFDMNEAQIIKDKIIRDIKQRKE